MRNLIFIFVSVFLVANVQAQDMMYARKLADTLSSDSFDGRGYVNRGMEKAASFLSSEFRKYGLESFGSSYSQPFSFPMNTLPGKLEVSIDGKKLIPGTEFQVWAAAPNLSGIFRLSLLKGKDITHPKRFQRFCRKDHSDRFILIDPAGIDTKKYSGLLDSLKYMNLANAKGLIFVTDQKLTWSVMIGFSPRSYPVLEISRNSLPGKARTISVDIESKYFREFPVQNLAGYVPGYQQPDTFLVFTAHYDHLGRMGQQVFYPGANDNASGTAMVMDFARYYSMPEHKPYYSMVFMLFAGEEAGLKGSTWYADHPGFDLQRIKFLVNLDMVGTGSEGITVVNATKYKEAYQRLVKLNADNEYLMTVKERGESCNSDHCPFYKKGVPAIFIYSMGPELKEYHNPDDNATNLPFTEYKDIFRLVRDFMDGAKTW